MPKATQGANGQPASLPPGFWTALPLPRPHLTLFLPAAPPSAPPATHIGLAVSTLGPSEPSRAGSGPGSPPPGPTPAMPRSAPSGRGARPLAGLLAPHPPAFDGRDPDWALPTAHRLKAALSRRPGTPGLRVLPRLPLCPIPAPHGGGTPIVALCCSKSPLLNQVPSAPGARLTPCLFGRLLYIHQNPALSYPPHSLSSLELLLRTLNLPYHCPYRLPSLAWLLGSTPCTPSTPSRA